MGVGCWISKLASVVHTSHQSVLVMLTGVTLYTKMIMFIGRMNDFKDWEYQKEWGVHNEFF